jgi:hypothetical protein
MDLQHHASAVGIDHGVTLAPVDFLARIISSWPLVSVVLTLWLSTIAALGLARLSQLDHGFGNFAPARWQ